MRLRESGKREKNGAYDMSGLKVAAARRSLKVISKLHAEVHALEYAVKWATFQVSNILVLSDNPTLIKELHSSDRCSDQVIVYLLNECLEYIEKNYVLESCQSSQ